MMYRTKADRLSIVMDIVMKLKKFKGKHGDIIDLYRDEYSFIEEFKKIIKQYIDQDDLKPQEFKGSLYFEEIDRTINYILPAKQYKQPLFVIKGKK
jgi:hypothetical protein